MRLKVGSMVEVLSKKDVLGAWRCAKIVEDNGDGYTVKYYRCGGIAKDSVDKVSAEAVRPCPRSAVGINNFVVGDVVEVLDDGYWRVSVIEDVIEDGDYYIRVIGSLDEFRVNNSSVRARQEWKQNKWVPMDKDSENRMDLTSRMLKKYQVQRAPESDLLPKSLKRSYSDHSSTTQTYSQCGQKRRLTDKELDAIHGDAYSFTGKELSRHVSLTATVLKMMLWLTTSSVVLSKGHHLQWLLCNEAIHVGRCDNLLYAVFCASFQNAPRL